MAAQVEVLSAWPSEGTSRTAPGVCLHTSSPASTDPRWSGISPQYCTHFCAPWREQFCRKCEVQRAHMCVIKVRRECLIMGSEQATHALPLPTGSTGCMMCYTLSRILTEKSVVAASIRYAVLCDLESVGGVRTLPSPLWARTHFQVILTALCRISRYLHLSPPPFAGASLPRDPQVGGQQ